MGLLLSMKISHSMEVTDFDKPICAIKRLTVAINIISKLVSLFLSNIFAGLDKHASLLSYIINYRRN